MDKITELKRKRFQFLRSLYEESGGDSLKMVKESDLANELGLNQEETDRIVEYLREEGLLEIPTFGGNVSITHWGVIQVEEALKEPEISTTYFPPVNIINLYSNTQGGSMTVFDQRGQQVVYQYNAAGDINLDAVQNKLDLVAELEKLQSEFSKAIEAGIFDEDTATDTEYQLKKAVQQAKKPDANKKSILEHLNEAKALIGGVTAATELVAALAEATEIIKDLF